ncbi:MAG TPA: hypothetical protein DCM86_13665, partial [Verrucomicrobiales bacterium]|nr:hypothetical protein [Verrucomicrobiales bacterium]
AGILSNICDVRISGTLTTNLTVTLYGNLGFDLIPFSPVVIPAGQTNVHFPLYVGDNGVIDPLRLAQVTATAPGFTDGVAGAFLFDNDGPPDPWTPYPPDQSDNISVHTGLSWGRVEGELVVNGTFETGDLAGWQLSDNGVGGFVVDNGTLDPVSPDGPMPPFSGGYGAVSQQLGNGHHELWQDIDIPKGATTVTVTWADRIRNHAGTFAPGQQQFRVEARDPSDNHLLWTLYASQPGDPLLGDWVRRTNYLSAYKGSTVRLAFVEDDQLGYLNVHLDEISVRAESPAPTSFDVYFGTNAIPSAADYAGSTTTSQWDLPLLAAGTDYYWRVDVKRAGMTNAGPVWTFRTGGVSSRTTLVGFGSSWKYWAQGTDLGIAYRAGSYSDAAWPSGAGILGFGGKETTTIGVASSGYVTYYFRKQFSIASAAKVVDLTARLIRDDGALVYINGALAMSDNMAGRITYQTQASSIISGTAETTPVVKDLNPALLVDGVNTIAVEVHQKHGLLAVSPDLLFDFALEATVNVANEPPVIALTSPKDFLSTQAPVTLPLAASVNDDNPAGLKVDFYA